jgi:hypothetical protein
VETLAPIDRTPCSPGEREAAEWLAARMEKIPGVEVSLEDEPSWGTFPPTATGLGVVGMVAAALVLSGRRATGALLAAAGLASIVDEAQNGPRILRRLVRRRRDTVNLVARAGERNGEAQDGGHGSLQPATARGARPPRRSADGDAVRPDAPARLYELAPSVIEGAKTPLPQWWIGLAGPLCTIAGAGLAPPEARAGGPRDRRAGHGAGGRRVAQPDGAGRQRQPLRGGRARRARRAAASSAPCRGCACCSSPAAPRRRSRTAIRAFLARHRHELDPERTWFVNLDTVGSPHLVMLEAEGPIWMEEYAGPWLRDLVAERAQQLEIELHRGYRARASTDSVIPSRAGYPTATLVSMTDWRSPANYHLPTDIPANLDYGTVAETTRLVYDVMRALAEGRALS